MLFRAECIYILKHNYKFLEVLGGPGTEVKNTLWKIEALDVFEIGQL